MKAPIYISIGPQCSGKTTFLSGIDGIVDISLDNVGSTYSSIDINVLFDDVIFPRGIDLRRYSDNAELVWISLLFKNMCTVDDAVANIGRGLRPSSLTSTLRQVLTEMLRPSDGVESAVMITETVDLFNASFRSTSAVALGLQQLSAALSDSSMDARPLAWGNTNLVPKFYRDILTLAHKHGRPVRFVRWGAELPAVSLTELYTRNICRFLATGRYIPIQTMSEFLGRANALLHLNLPGGGGSRRSERGGCPVRSTGSARSPMPSTSAPALPASQNIEESVFSTVVSAGTSFASMVASSASSSSSVSVSGASSDNGAMPLPRAWGSGDSNPAVVGVIPTSTSTSTSTSTAPVLNNTQSIAEPAELAILAGYRLDTSGLGTVDPIPDWGRIGDRQLCRLYMTGQCPFGSRCRYAHVRLTKQS